MTDDSNQTHSRSSAAFTRRTFLGMTVGTGTALLLGEGVLTLGKSSARAANTGESSTFQVGGDLTVNRLGFGAMRLTGDGIWGWPSDRGSAVKVLKRAVELGVNLIDTADAYGPEVSE